VNIVQRSPIPRQMRITFQRPKYVFKRWKRNIRSGARTIPCNYRHPQAGNPPALPVKFPLNVNAPMRMQLPPIELLQAHSQTPPCSVMVSLHTAKGSPSTQTVVRVWVSAPYARVAITVNRDIRSALNRFPGSTSGMLIPARVGR